MIVLGLGSCLIAIATLAAIALLDRIEANRGTPHPPRALNASRRLRHSAAFCAAPLQPSSSDVSQAPQAQRKLFMTARTGFFIILAVTVWRIVTLHFRHDGFLRRRGAILVLVAESRLRLLFEATDDCLVHPVDDGNCRLNRHLSGCGSAGLSCIWPRHCC